MPWKRSDGSSFDHTYQSRYGEFGSAQAALNHGCSFDVWFTTRSMITRRPRLLGLVDELGEVAQAAEPGVDAVEVGHVVAVVLVRPGMDGVEPDAGDAQPGQVVEPAGEAGEVADPVTVGVLERLDVEAVDDGLLVPALMHDGGTYPAGRRTTASPPARMPSW